jgi:hypothetical protein
VKGENHRKASGGINESRRNERESGMYGDNQKLMKAKLKS